ncbi:uncharacterized protein Hap1MRO34_023449 isoform 1-T1 [Clarias gariepinus]
MGLLSETLCSLTLEADAGDKVTIWWQHNLTGTGYIYWFKHTSDSVSLLIGCKQFFTSAPSETCYSFTESESERIVTADHDKNTSLTITAVNVSDTGLYYCIYMEKNQIPFSDSVYLRVKGVNKTLTKITDRANGSDCPAVSFMLTAGFGAVIVILLSVLIFIILKHKGHEASKNEDPEADSVHYAALHLSKKKNKRANKCNEMVDPHVVYSLVGQTNVHT